MKGIDDFGFNEEQKRYVREIVERRRRKTQKAFFDRYGVKSIEELDALFGLAPKRVFNPNVANPTNEEALLALLEWAMEELAARPTIPTKGEIQRLFDELTTIAAGNNAWAILKISWMAHFCTLNNEPFIIPGPGATSYLLYLLGVAKFNPVAIGSRSEDFLGLRDKPKTFNEISFKVRPGFGNTLEQYAIVNFAGYSPFYDSDGKGEVVPNQIRFVKDGVDTQGELLEVRTKYPLLKDCRAFLDCSFVLHIYEDERMQSVKDLLDHNPRLKPEQGLQNLLTCISKGRSFSPALDELQKRVGIPKLSDLNDIITFYSSTMVSAEGGLLWPLCDRDSMLNYFDQTSSDRQANYRITEDIRHGRAKEESMGQLDEDMRKKFVSIQYLPSRGSSSEIAYLALILAAGIE